MLAKDLNENQAFYGEVAEELDASNSETLLIN